MLIKTEIPHTLTLEECTELKSYISNKDIKKALNFINQNIAYKDNLMVSTWAYGTYYAPPNKKLSVEPKGSFDPNSDIFRMLRNSCITLSVYESNNYIKELRIQTIPLPL